jgi:putative peptidoglycan lipid II flippase
MTATPGSDAQSSRTRHLARSTLIVMVAFGLAKVISLAQTFIIARVFGVGAEWDAFVTANRIPELIFTLIAGGALAHAFIPIFSGYLAREDYDGGWRTASQVINFIFCATFIASAVAYVAAPWLIANFVAPGFTDEARETTVGLMRVLLISTLIFSVSGIVMGILQSFNHFVLPAIAPMMFDVGILIGVLFFLPAFGVYGIAYGAVLGAALHLGIQIPGLIRFRARWTPSLGLRNPVLWRVIRLMLPRVAGLGVFSVNFIVMNNIASRLGTGSVSALDWGWRLMQIPQTLIGTAMGTVIFPTLAQLSALGDESGKRDNMTGALKFILIGSIPSALGLIFVGRPLISLLEGGQFDASASDLVFSTLQFFALGLIVHSVLEVIARSFYADSDTLTPLWAALGGAAINLVLSFTLSGVAQAESALSAYGVVAATAPGLLAPRPDFGFVGGLALANSLGVMFEVVFLMIVLRKRWHGINENALATTALKTLAASLVMTAAIVAVDLVWVALDLGSRGRMLLIVEIAVQVGVGILVFAGTAALLRMEELRMLMKLVLRRKSEAVA